MDLFTLKFACQSALPQDNLKNYCMIKQAINYINKIRSDQEKAIYQEK